MLILDGALGENRVIALIAHGIAAFWMAYGLILLSFVFSENLIRSDLSLIYLKIVFTIYILFYCFYLI